MGCTLGYIKGAHAKVCYAKIKDTHRLLVTQRPTELVLLQIDISLTSTMILLRATQYLENKKQVVVIRSSAECQYRAMTLATCELV